MSGSSPRPNGANELKRLEQKIHLHAETLLTQHLPDLLYGRSKFGASYDRAAFRRSKEGRTPAERDAANSVVAAWDAAMNDLNEILRNAYGLKHGFRRTGPDMPTVYADPDVAPGHETELRAMNRARNQLTHAYPLTGSDALYDAIETFLRVLKPVLRNAKACAAQYGVDIPAVT